MLAAQAAQAPLERQHAVHVAAVVSDCGGKPGSCARPAAELDRPEALLTFSPP